MVGQVLVSPHEHGHGRRRWPIWSPSRDLPALADALGQTLTALDRRPAWRPHQGDHVSTCRPGRDTVAHGHVSAVVLVIVRKKSAKSPQKVRKTSINVDHRWTPSDTIRAGQRPFGGQTYRSGSRPNRVYTAVGVGSSPAGPTYFYRSQRPIRALRSSVADDPRDR